MNLLTLCQQSVNNIERCTSFLNNISFQKNIFFSSLTLENFFLFIFLFLILFIFLNKITLLKTLNKHVLTFINLNFSLFLFFIIIYPSNIPFTDTWQEIDILINYQKKNLFNENGSGHPFVLFRILHLILIEHFLLNYTIFHVTNFVIYFFSCLFLIFYLNKFRNIYLLLISLLILFSGKWLNILLEPVNIAWTINFFLTISVVIILDLRDNYAKYIILTALLLLSVMNFGGSLALLFYFIIYVIFHDKEYKIKISLFLPIIVSVFFLIAFQYYNRNSASVATVDISSLSLINLLKFLKNYLGLSAAVYFPYLTQLKPFYVLVGLVQNIIVLKCIFFNKKNYLEIIKDTVLKNPFLILGIFGCSLISLARGENFEQIRYFSFSILFQLGFFVLIYEYYSKLFSFIKKKIFIFLFISLYLISIIGPNTGLHFSISRASIAERINKCISLNNKDCNQLIYDLTYYGGTWFDYSKFEYILNYIKNNKLSLFSK
jgi:hypothetical protein